MKKILVVLCCLMIGLAAFAVTGCGDKYGDSPYVGTWKATTAEYAGIEMDVEEVIGEFVLTLDADGSAKVKLKGEESTGTWEPTDNGFTVDESGEMEFVPDGDGISVDYAGVNIYFEKQQ